VTDAYGGAGTFRKKPALPSLIAAICTLPSLPVLALRRPAAPPWMHDLSGPVLVYLDPPYAAGAGYGATLGRAEVVALAQAWRAAGAAVMVSEAEPIDIPGWRQARLGSTAVRQSPIQHRPREEWVTYSGPAAPQALP